MAAQNHSFSTRSANDTAFIATLKASERRRGRANFSYVVIMALRDYAEKREAEEAILAAANS